MVFAVFSLLINPPHIMSASITQDLKYGIIYLYCDRSLLSGSQGIEDVVNKFVRPMQVEWIDEPGREDLLLIARRFNVGNIGHYATVSLSLSPRNQSGAWFEAINHFADVLISPLGQLVVTTTISPTLNILPPPILLNKSNLLYRSIRY